MEYLTVTCVKPNRGFLHIYGHKKPELLDQLKAEISAYKPSIKQITGTNDLNPNLEFDTIYLVSAADNGTYHRCTVREKRPNNKAIIDLIDYGNDFEVDTKYVSSSVQFGRNINRYRRKMKKIANGANSVVCAILVAIARLITCSFRFRLTGAEFHHSLFMQSFGPLRLKFAQPNQIKTYRSFN